MDYNENFDKNTNPMQEPEIKEIDLENQPQPESAVEADIAEEKKEEPQADAGVQPEAPQQAPEKSEPTPPPLPRENPAMYGQPAGGFVPPQYAPRPQQNWQPQNGRWQAPPPPANGQNPYYRPAPPQQPPYQQYQQYQQPNRPPVQPGYPNSSAGWNFEGYEQKTATPPKKKNIALRIVGIIVAICISLGVLSIAGIGIVTAVLAGVGEGNSNGVSSSHLNAASGLEITDVPSEDEPEVVVGEKLTPTQVAEKVLPSIVGVVNYARVTSNGVSGYQVAGQGSGIIFDKDGYIVTNYHVVEDAAKVKVVLSCGEGYDAEIVASDPKSDLSVLKIDATVELVAAEFGNSNQAKVGETVFAVGNPGGLELAGSFTGGYISATNRLIRGESGYSMNCLQTDAAISPGNSGGALVNLYGQVIGINSSKIADTDYEGIGFAISISEAVPIISDLLEFGYVKGRVKLGITYRFVDEVEAEFNNIEQGLLVYTVDEFCDVFKKGLEAGDLITKVDGQAIRTENQIIEYLKGKKPGDQITLTIFRKTGVGKKTFDITVTLYSDAE